MHPLFPLALHLLLQSLFSSPVSATSNQCSIPHSASTCPPFRSPVLLYPFSSSPGCGHPSFHINCSQPHSTISISSSQFLLLDQTSTSFLLTPSNSLPSSPSSSCPSLPSHPIDFSNTPFHISPDTCDRLSSLQFCHSPVRNSSSTCGLTSFQHRLLSKPQLLITSCKNSTSSNSTHIPCAGDIPNSILGFLQAGIRVHWNLSSDPYFINCSSCPGGTCGYNTSLPSKPFICFSSSSQLTSQINRHIGSTPSVDRGKGHFLLLTTTLFAVACFVILLLLYLCATALIRRSRQGCSLRAAFGSEPVAALLRSHHLQPPVFTYDQLSIATSDFDQIRKIGDGGFGSVYLAEFCDGSLAAVKRLHRYQPEAALAATTTKSFYNEIVILSTLRHPNLVRLHGYCVDPRGLLLVYDYVPNGTLAEHLHGSRRTCPGLSWYVRVDIALQTAMALEYLHFGLKPPVVHRDVTSSNIFVGSDMQVRLGDFGLSRLLTCADACSTSVSRELICCTGPQGTPGYLDPEYHRSFRLTEKSDVYSFGVVLMELVTGMRAVDVSRERREITLADYIVGKIQQGQLREVVDPVLGQEEDVMISIEAVAELAFRCVAGDKDDRPNAREVVEELRRIKGKLSDGWYPK
ncbi:hypothetical protein LUZ61_009222 [Rhynchospora tenuis]|uniref:Protein kinase domain-containing protein n=1 Tax=Rhynchospora tenuis TaxID=198213 RepID=A0AAD5ZX05_9POAL|nr:hypothetical protein LUZ61_009222 [Rhynchospora tenuis]